jgi:hypothetical protein
MNEAEDQEVRHRNPLLWPLRFLLHWIIKTLVFVFLGIRFVLRPKPVRYGLVAVLVLGVLAWGIAGPQVTGRVLAMAGLVPSPSPAIQASQAAPTAPASSATTVSVEATKQLARSPVVESYLQAQANFDANGMWDTISDTLKQQLASSNTTVQQLQDELDAAKQAGRQYSSALYVGGAQIDSSSSAYFYVLTVDTPGGTTRVPYIYVVGQDGKIDSIQ